VYGVDVKGNDTAARVAAAAMAILAEEGADAVSMRRVATAVGITPMAIYRHYPNREALLRAVADVAGGELGEGWGKRLTGRDLETRWSGLLEDFLDFALGKPHLYSFLMVDGWSAARRFPEDFRDHGSPAFTHALEAVEEGMREGLLKAGDPLEVALTITASSQGLVLLYLSGRIELSEPEFRLLCRRSMWRIINGLRT
jgi:AcrR family transcriptional regulator